MAGKKPITLGEVGRPSTVDFLHEQPRWTWFMLWGDPSHRWPEQQAFQTLYESPETITLEDLPWVSISRPTIHYPVLK